MRIGYDDDALYFAFECPEPRMDLIKASATTHDSSRADVSIFGDDAVEIFTDVNLDLTTYAQWVFNAIGTQAEGQYYNFSIFNEPWEVKVVRGDNYWNAEARIPYTSLGAVARPGQTWGINVYRNVKTFEPPKGEITEAQRREGWKDAESHCFSTPYFGYHNARRFGRVTFGPRSP